MNEEALFTVPFAFQTYSILSLCFKIFRSCTLIASIWDLVKGRLSGEYPSNVPAAGTWTTPELYVAEANWGYVVALFGGAEGSVVAWTSISPGSFALSCN